MSKVVKVVWEDSSVMPGIWNSADDLAKDINHVCTSVGYLVHDDEDCIVVAAHRGPHGDYAGAMRIPKRTLIRMRTVDTYAA